MATKKKKNLRFNDGIENLKTMLGTAVDVKTSTEFSELELDKDEIERAYRYDWLFAKAVDVPAKDMTRKWLTFNGKKKSVRAIKEHYKRLKVKKVVRKALVFKAMYGVSYLVIESTSKSLKSRLKNFDEIKKIHVYHKFEINKKNDIHESRIYEMEQNFFKDSLLNKLYSSILNLLTSLEIPASLMHKSDIDFLSIKNLANMLSKCKKSKDCNDAEEKILKRIQAIYEQVSMFKIGIKDSEESYESFTKDLSNFDSLQQMYMQVVAGAADIPLTRFFGTVPKGLNATGEGDLQNYYDSLSSLQDELIEPFLEKLNDNLIEAYKINDKNFSFEFAPIRDITPKEKADIDNTKASTISMFIDELDPETIVEALKQLDVFKNIEL